MIRHTFLHIPGIGPNTERRLWEQGVLDWDCVRGSLSATIPATRRKRLLREVDESLNALLQLDSRYFAGRLPSKHLWRLYSEFHDSVAFFDIETTGLDFLRDEITTIALYDGREVHTYVRGRNLEQFASDIGRYQLLVTYNGRCFDAPFVEAQFPGVKLDQAHIDLRYVLAALGFRGGLKRCEELMGVARPAGIKDVDGFMAVRLWHAHMKGDHRALPALLRYNAEDTINLRWLMDTAYNMMIAQLPIAVSPVDVADRPSIEMPFDASVVEEVMYSVW